MRIINTTRHTVLADRARKAGNFIARARGLMFSPPLDAGGGLIIDPCNSIHMLFMRYPLDVLFVDRLGRVVFMYQGIKPWRVGRIVRGAKLVVELPAGTVSTTGTQVGDEVVITGDQ
jgi:uncharacterized membrane protein (UPF0127 family)